MLTCSGKKVDIIINFHCGTLRQGLAFGWPHRQFQVDFFLKFSYENMEKWNVSKFPTRRWKKFHAHSSSSSSDESCVQSVDPYILSNRASDRIIFGHFVKDSEFTIYWGKVFDEPFDIILMRVGFQVSGDTYNDWICTFNPMNECLVFYVHHTVSNSIRFSQL